LMHLWDKFTILATTGRFMSSRWNYFR
jgi:hypothetical protein